MNKESQYFSDIFKYSLLNENILLFILFKITLSKSVHEGPIDNNNISIGSDKSLPKPIFTKFYDTIWHQ